MAEPKGAGDDPDKGAFRVELEALRNEIKKSEGITGSIAGWLGVGELSALREKVDGALSETGDATDAGTARALATLFAASACTHPRVASRGMGSVQHLLERGLLGPGHTRDLVAALNIHASSPDRALPLRALQVALALMQSPSRPTATDEIQMTLWLCFQLAWAQKPTQPHTVQGTAGAVLRQAVSVVFNQLAAECAAGVSSAGDPTQAPRAEPLAQACVHLLSDLCLLAEGSQGTWLSAPNMPSSVALALLEEALTCSPGLVASHKALRACVRDVVTPTALRCIATVPLPLGHPDRGHHSRALLALASALVVRFARATPPFLPAGDLVITACQVGAGHPWLQALAIRSLRPLCGDPETLQALVMPSTSATANEGAGRPPRPVATLARALAAPFAQLQGMPGPEAVAVLRELEESVESRAAAKGGERRSMGGRKGPLGREAEPPVGLGVVCAASLECVLSLARAAQGLSSAAGTEGVDSAPSDNTRAAAAFVADVWEDLHSVLALVLNQCSSLSIVTDSMMALQGLIVASGSTGLPEARDLMLQTLCTLALPGAEEAAAGEEDPRLSARNQHALRHLINVLQELGARMGSGWDVVLRTLDALDPVLTSAPVPARAVPRDVDAAALIPESATSVLASAALEAVAAAGRMQGRALAEFVAGLRREAARVLRALPGSGDARGVPAWSRLVRAVLGALLSQPGLWDELAGCVLEVARDAHPNTAVAVCESLGAVASEALAVRERAAAARSAEVADKTAEGVEDAARPASGEDHRAEGSDVVGESPAFNLEVSVLETFSGAFSTAHDASVSQAVLASLFAVVQRHAESFTAAWTPLLDLLPRVALSAQPAVVAGGFRITQSLCNDFLDVVPRAQLRPLIQVCVAYARQTAAVNVSLTALGALWTLADFFTQASDAALGQGSQADADVDVLMVEGLLQVCQSVASLVSDPRSELRNTALRTLFSLTATTASTARVWLLPASRLRRGTPVPRQCTAEGKLESGPTASVSERSLGSGAGPLSPTRHRSVGAFDMAGRGPQVLSTPTASSSARALPSPDSSKKSPGGFMAWLGLGGTPVGREASDGAASGGALPGWARPQVQETLFQKVLAELIMPAVVTLCDKTGEVAQAGGSPGGIEIGRVRGQPVTILVHHTLDSARKQWDETLSIALGSFTRLFRLHWKEMVALEALVIEWENLVHATSALVGDGRKDVTLAGLGLLVSALHELAHRGADERAQEDGRAGQEARREGGPGEAEGSSVAGRVSGGVGGSASGGAVGSPSLPATVVQSSLDALIAMVGRAIRWEGGAPLSVRLELCRALTKVLSTSTLVLTPSQQDQVFRAIDLLVRHPACQSDPSQPPDTVLHPVQKAVLEGFPQALAGMPRERGSPAAVGAPPLSPRLSMAGLSPGLSLGPVPGGAAFDAPAPSHATLRPTPEETAFKALRIALQWVDPASSADTPPAPTTPTGARGAGAGDAPPSGVDGREAYAQESVTTEGGEGAGEAADVARPRSVGPALRKAAVELVQHIYRNRLTEADQWRVLAPIMDALGACMLPAVRMDANARDLFLGAFRAFCSLLEAPPGAIRGAGEAGEPQRGKEGGAEAGDGGGDAVGGDRDLGRRPADAAAVAAAAAHREEVGMAVVGAVEGFMRGPGAHGAGGSAGSAAPMMRRSTSARAVWPGSSMGLSRYDGGQGRVGTEVAEEESEGASVGLRSDLSMAPSAGLEEARDGLGGAASGGADSTQLDTDEVVMLDRACHLLHDPAWDLPSAAAALLVRLVASLVAAPPESIRSGLRRRHLSLVCLTKLAALCSTGLDPGPASARAERVCAMALSALVDACNAVLARAAGRDFRGRSDAALVGFALDVLHDAEPALGAQEALAMPSDHLAAVQRLWIARGMPQRGFGTHLLATTPGLLAMARCACPDAALRAKVERLLRAALMGE